MTAPSALAQAAERTQRRAADPAASVWVGASAGTGKTKVLTDRVLRLLLSGTPPGRILCLTFTKAAAAEMADRLAANLAAWAAMPESELTEKLSALLGRAPERTERTAARRLFAAVLDAPEALRIETLHGFAQGLLRRFPVEAGVSPTFEVMDERTSQEMLRRARERVFRETAPGTPLAGAIAAITNTVSDAEFPKLISAITGARVRIGRALAAWGGAAAMAAGLARHYGLAPGDTAESLRAAACRDAACDLSGLRRLCAAMETLGTATDKKQAPRIAAWLAADAAERPALWADYVEAFLTKEGEPRSTERYPGKAVQESDPGLVEILAAEQDRLLAVEDSLRAAHAAAMTAHLVALADAAFSAYEREKRRGALLDYDDLIEKALSLLSSAEARPWVLYKLDGGLDHVLVDEAQDTSPDQWAVVGALTAEFFAGEGARGETGRTLFAVGDIKQSIYRFQGAEPRMFAAERARVAAAAAEAGLPFDAVPLDISFRSVPAVLEAVDAVFATPEAAEGVLDPGRAIAEQRHVAARENAPGLVELWPRLPVPETPEETPWNPPVERLSVPSAAARCAALVAERIARMVGADGAEPEILAAKGRTIRPGDIMVLVRKRDAFQTDLIRALKKLGVAVAGADRLNLADHMAVQDCLALAEAALFPGDDLTLATALKGPFLGWSEEALFAAAHGRGDGVTLWTALRAMPHARQAVEKIEAWGVAARSLRPFAFFARLLEAEGGRAALRRRLGAEVDDPLDEILDLAQGFERGHAGTVQGFLAWFAAGSVEIKRDMDQGGGGAVRILTVHGAKGLQAPVVFLPQTGGGRPTAPAFEWAKNKAGRPLLLWKPPHAKAPEALAEAREAREAEDERESRRLLYVAMTRAEDRLTVCGWEMRKSPAAPSWHDLVRAGMQRLGAAEEEDPTLAAAFGGPTAVLRWRGLAPASAPPRAAEAAAPAATAALPAWIDAPPPPEPHPGRPLMPSRPDAEDPPAASPLAATEGDRFRRGTLMHRLLQCLPELPAAERTEAARRFLSAAAAGWPEEAREACADEVRTVLALPEAQALFGPNSRAEVPVSGRIETAAGPRLISGQIDRLAVTATEVLIADYKTNRNPPATPDDVPEAYRRQLAAYAAALAAMFPSHRVRTFLLWTDGPALMEVPVGRDA